MTTDQPFQLPLSVSLSDDARFENFYSQGNELVCASVKAAAQGRGEQFTFLWGEEGAGCSHLLQAACHEAEPLGRSSAYLPINELHQMGVGILDGLEYLEMVCLDHIDIVCGRPDWEEALFHLFNRIRQLNHTLIVAAQLPPKQLGIKLPDLSSRLSWGVVYQVHSMDDSMKLEAIQMKALARGMVFSEDVARYILHHSSRNMNDLTRILDRLDRLSLSKKRKVTIPFVKDVLEL